MKTNVFKKAHKITKKIIKKGDSYRETFRLALIFVYSEIRKGVNKMITKQEISKLKDWHIKELNKEEVIETELGTLKYVNGKSPVYSGWYIFKEEGNVIARDLKDVIQELNGYTVKYPNNLYTEEFNKKKEEKRKKEREKFYADRGNCWECGCKLDRNGNCMVCGCSKEIYQF